MPRAKRLTLAAVRAELRPLGLVVKKSYDDGITVNFRGAPSETAYHAWDSLEDALATGKAMAREREDHEASGGPECPYCGCHDRPRRNYDPKTRARNPWTCVACNGVGGGEDFGYWG